MQRLRFCFESLKKYLNLGQLFHFVMTVTIIIVIIIIIFFNLSARVSILTSILGRYFIPFLIQSVLTFSFICILFQVSMSWLPDTRSELQIKKLKKKKEEDIRANNSHLLPAEYKLLPSGQICSAQVQEKAFRFKSGGGYLIAWITYYLMGRPRIVRLQHLVS